VTLNGTSAIDEFEELSDTTASMSRMWLSVTIIVQLAPGASNCEQPESEIVGPKTLTAEVSLPPPSAGCNLAVIVTRPPTDSPVTQNEADVVLAGIVTESGTEAIPGWELESKISVGWLRA
jgi:hypothetical protein